MIVSFLVLTAGIVFGAKTLIAKPESSLEPTFEISEYVPPRDAKPYAAPPEFDEFGNPFPQ